MIIDHELSIVKVDFRHYHDKFSYIERKHDVHDIVYIKTFEIFHENDEMN